MNGLKMRFNGLWCGIESEHVGGGHRCQDHFSPAGFFMCSRQQQRKGNSSPGGATFITDSMDLPQYSRLHWGRLNMTDCASISKRQIHATWKCTRKVTRGICRKAKRTETLHPIPRLESVNSQRENTFSEWTQKASSRHGGTCLLHQILECEGRMIRSSRPSLAPQSF